ncbi:MAG TPA: PilZ domain-containing protein [Clostridia bacterium]
MGNNRLVIGNKKEKDKSETNDLRDIAGNTQTIAPDIQKEPSKEPIYEKLWGNDNNVLNKLDEQQLADRRLFVRAIYMQKIECKTILESLDSEPTILKRPIEFMIIDISMGGIGVLCEYEMNIGTILVFRLILDNIPYEVNGEVAYCFPNDDKFRAGLKIVNKDKQFIKHLKIFVARSSLQRRYGADERKL